MSPVGKPWTKEYYKGDNSRVLDQDSKGLVHQKALQEAKIEDSFSGSKGEEIHKWEG